MNLLLLRHIWDHPHTLSQTCYSCEIILLGYLKEYCHFTKMSRQKHKIVCSLYCVLRKKNIKHTIKMPLSLSYFNLP